MIIVFCFLIPVIMLQASSILAKRPQEMYGPLGDFVRVRNALLEVPTSHPFEEAALKLLPDPDWVTSREEPKFEDGHSNHRLVSNKAQFEEMIKVVKNYPEIAINVFVNSSGFVPLVCAISIALRSPSNLS